MDYQAGKLKDRRLKELTSQLDRINSDFSGKNEFKERDPVEFCALLQSFKEQFLQFDEDLSGDINLVELGRMMEKIGQPKNLLELKKMIAEIDSTNSGAITYIDFLTMMLGGKTTVLKLILMFEKKKGETCLLKPRGPPPRRSLESLP